MTTMRPQQPFASHRAGDRVNFNTGPIGGKPEPQDGAIVRIDKHGTATIQIDDGTIFYRDICVL